MSSVRSFFVCRGIWALALATTMPGLTACDTGKVNASVAAPQVARASEPTPEPERPIETIVKLETLAEAVDFAKPYMTDTQNSVSPGAALLAAWAVKHMTANDVVVTRDETSFAKVQKDADEERGKRICVTGRIVQIRVSKTDFGKLAEGLLLSNRGTLFNYANVGSSGDLVAQSAARTCGVVIGTYDYSNSAGGTGHAVQLVGMFDLPANRN